MSPPPTIARLHQPVSETDILALARLLVETVESGAAVSFLAPLPEVRAADWWRGALASSAGGDGSARGPIVLVARDAQGIVGTVQLQPAWAPNQPHRAEVAKLMVASRSQRSGLGARLMAAVEETARDCGFTLLTLDAKRGGAAERLYHRAGWTCVGVIPLYALDPDGRAWHDTVVFYKALA